MPNTEINTPHSTGAIDRLTLTTAEVRGTDSNMLGSPACCLPPACCGCFEGDAETV